MTFFFLSVFFREKTVAVSKIPITVAAGIRAPLQPLCSAGGGVVAAVSVSVKVVAGSVSGSVSASVVTVAVYFLI